jgi:sugar fermentation stimulation protein A
MEFCPPLIEARLVRRYKRFLADIELASGQVILAHCPNPGAMRTCAPDRARVWVWKTANPKRKLAYTWELVEAEGALVCVNTARANSVIAEAIAAAAIPELAGYASLRPEVAVGQSRIDFQLAGHRERAGVCFVEVKNVTLHLGDRVGAFPDSVTTRGTRHLRELMAIAAGGDRAVLMFCVGRDPTDKVVPAAHIDPVYAETLREAAGSGVEVLAYACAISEREIRLAGRVPVDLDAST